ncbi:MFS transporter [Phenylobacterium sp.]|uniref:MFS transporter n=1 Tax=Phenylobacterium sp. TaxID=1871053 RepID=UPI00289D2B37|nr:MFS transporter [Phenylobacterium sp.]
MHLGRHPVFDEAQRARAAKVLTAEVVFSTTCDTMMTGVLLTAFALHLGATNALIGILAAVGFWAQLLQGPGVILIERLRRRRAITVVTSLVSAIAPAVLAGLAFAAPGGAAQAGFAVAVALYTGAGAIGGCAWNAWVRDAVSDDERGRFNGRRSSLSSAVAVVAGLLAAWVLDSFPEGDAARPAVFAGLFVLAFLAQLASAWGLSRAPEPPMPPPPKQPARLLPLLREPLRHPNYRRLIAFLASWQFAVNLAQPFLTVFMLSQLGFSMTFVMVVNLVSQFANMLSLRRWGVLADRFSNKSVLNVSAPLFVGCIAALVVASQIHSRTLAGAYLVLLALVMGVASAGVSLASGAIAQKLSPPGAAASFLAANALVSAAAAGSAAILGGLTADAFAQRALALAVQWEGPHYDAAMQFSIHHWDFYFLISALLGLYALHRMTLVHEGGELDRRTMLARMRQDRRTRHEDAATDAATAAPWHLLLQNRAQRRQRALDRYRRAHG